MISLAVLWLQSQMIPAIEAGNTYRVQRLLAEGANPNERDAAGESLLHIAATLADTGPAWLLVRAGANIEAVDPQGVTPLMTATLNGRPEVARFLLRRGAKPNVQDKRGRSALHWASNWARPDRNDREPDQARALIADYLIRFKANLNLADQSGATPLMLAAKFDHPAVAEVLLAFGARPMLRDHLGRTALTFAAWLGPKDPIVVSLLDKGILPGVTEFLEFKMSAKALPLIRRGGNVSIPGRYGESTLHLASATSSVACVSALLERSVPVNAADDYGWTALMLAVVGRPNATQLSGMSTFHPEGTEAERLEIVKALVGAKAKTALRNKAGQSALDLAEQTVQESIIAYLRRVQH